MPVLGTCAGLIVLARRLIGGEPLLGVLDVTVRRNAYGRQVDSFEADVSLTGDAGEEAVRGVFIRAPVIEDVGPRVRVLAEHAGLPAVVEEGNVLAAAFHPELAGEDALHRRLLDRA
jgi:5'-phosphate synthase pdxT subunit